jgi:hypothetical protein
MLHVRRVLEVILFIFIILFIPTSLPSFLAGGMTKNDGDEDDDEDEEDGFVFDPCVTRRRAAWRFWADVPVYATRLRRRDVGAGGLRHAIWSPAYGARNALRYLA